MNNKSVLNEEEFNSVINTLTQVKTYADIIYDGVSIPNHPSERVYGYIEEMKNKIYLAKLQELLPLDVLQEAYQIEPLTQKDKIHDNEIPQEHES